MRLPRTTYEQRKDLYSDVDSLLDYGFLTSKLSVFGVPFVIRSMNSVDRFLFDFRSTDDELWKVDLVAASVWMVDGWVVPSDSNFPRVLRDILLSQPRSVRSVFYHATLDLFSRVMNAIDATEAYAYESTSRYKWKSMGGVYKTPSVSLSTGENNVQRLWVFFNQVEDKKIEEELAWEKYKMLASVHSPDGIKKMDQRDKTRSRTEENRRSNVLDLFFYTSKKYIKPEQIDTSLLHRSSAKDDDDLVEEMRKVIMGEEDDFDRIINSKKQAVIDAYEGHKNAIEEQRQELIARRTAEETDEDGLTDGGSIVSVDIQDISSAHQRVVIDHVEQERIDTKRDQWIRKPQAPDFVTVDEDGRVVPKRSPQNQDRKVVMTPE